MKREEMLAKKDGIGKNSIWVLFFSAVALFWWVLQLKDTDSYFSIYILIVEIGLLAIALNYLTGYIITISKKKKIFLLCVSSLFSEMVWLSNYQIFRPFSSHIPQIVIQILIGNWIFLNIMIAVSKEEIKSNDINKSNIRIHPRIIQFGFLALFAVVYLGYLFFVAYPGNLSVDSLEQIEQALIKIVSNHHPYCHTLLVQIILKFGMLLFGNINSAVALYSVVQLMFVAYVFSYIGMTLYQMKIPIGTMLMIMMVYLLPFHITYSSTMWKDIYFAGGVSLYITSHIRLYKNIGNQAMNAIALSIGVLLFALFRSNGLVALVISVVILLPIYHPKKIMVLTAVLIFFSFIIKHPVLDAIGIKQPDTVEFLSIPEQQIARVFAEGRQIEEQDSIVLSQIYDLGTIKEDYNPRVSNAIKENIRRTGLDYLSNNKLLFFKTWIRLGIKYPSDYIKAWIDQTKGFWNGGYKYWILYHQIAHDYGYDETTGQSKTFGIYSDATYNWLTEIYNSWIQVFEEKSFFEPFRSIGIQFWMALIMLFVGVFWKRNDWIIASCPLVTIVMTLLLTTPIFCEFRYAYSLFTSFPILVGVMMSKGSELYGEEFS